MLRIGEYTCVLIVLVTCRLERLLRHHLVLCRLLGEYVDLRCCSSCLRLLLFAEAEARDGHPGDIIEEEVFSAGKHP